MFKSDVTFRDRMRSEADLWLKVKAEMRMKEEIAFKEKITPDVDIIISAIHSAAKQGDKKLTYLIDSKYIQEIANILIGEFNLDACVGENCDVIYLSWE